jgi:type II secretory pathway pseudopilin PulG
MNIDPANFKRRFVGGTGDSPVPPGHWPGGNLTAAVGRPPRHDCAPSLTGPVGGSPTGTGGSPVPPRKGAPSAFTIIEIAISLAVIGFALVAIIGVLPVGLNVQRETHQDTIIGQDGSFFLEAIRNGGPTNGPGTSTSLDFLTNYVESIVVTNLSNGLPVRTYTINNPASGQVILGLLSTPSSLTTARVRGMTGAATEQNGSNGVTAFRYYMNVEIEPFTTASSNSFDIITTNTNPESTHLTYNLWEVRLKFSWPIVNTFSGKVGPGRQSYRCLISGSLLPNTNGAPTLWFFQPNAYN